MFCYVRTMTSTYYSQLTQVIDDAVSKEEEYQKWQMIFLVITHMLNLAKKEDVPQELLQWDGLSALFGNAPKPSGIKPPRLDGKKPPRPDGQTALNGLIDEEGESSPDERDEGIEEDDTDLDADTDYHETHSAFSTSTGAFSASTGARTVAQEELEGLLADQDGAVVVASGRNSTASQHSRRQKPKRRANQPNLVVIVTANDILQSGGLSLARDFTKEAYKGSIDDFLQDLSGARIPGRINNRAVVLQFSPGRVKEVGTIFFAKMISQVGVTRVNGIVRAQVGDTDHDPGLARRAEEFAKRRNLPSALRKLVTSIAQAAGKEPTRQDNTLYLRTYWYQYRMVDMFDKYRRLVAKVKAGDKAILDAMAKEGVLSGKGRGASTRVKEYLILTLWLKEKELANMLQSASVMTVFVDRFSYGFLPLVPEGAITT
jgi:hypothetical protein